MISPYALMDNRLAKAELALMSSHLYIERQTTIKTKLRRVRIIEVRECDLRFGNVARSSLDICTECAEVSMMLSPDSAAEISAVGVDDISELVELGEIHFTDGEGGLRVCLNSIVERPSRRA